MAEYQILWTRQEEPDPKLRRFVHILEVGVADSVGNYLGAWTVKEVIRRIKNGDRFMVAAVVWDGVQVMTHQHDDLVCEYIQTTGNKLAVTNLKFRHQHGKPEPAETFTTVSPA